MLRQRDQRLTDYMLKTYEMPLTQLRGVHTDLADVPRSLPFRTFKNNENYVTQLHEIPTALAQTIEVLKQGEKDGLMPLRSLLEQVPEQCRGIAGEDPFDRRLRQQSHCNPGRTPFAFRHPGQSTQQRDRDCRRRAESPIS